MLTVSITWIGPGVASESAAKDTSYHKYRGHGTVGMCSVCVGMLQIYECANFELTGEGIGNGSVHCSTPFRCHGMQWCIATNSVTSQV